MSELTLPAIDTPYAEIDIEEMILVTRRLSELLREEVRLLQTMDITAAGALQPEKETLTKVLEMQKKHIELQPEAMEQIDAQDKARLGEVVADFQEALHQNIRLVAVAKVVNQRVVQAVMDTLAEQHTTGAYSKQGVTITAPKQGLSVTLNQQI